MYVHTAPKNNIPFLRTVGSAKLASLRQHAESQ